LDTGTSASLIHQTILTDKDKHKLQNDEQGQTLWKTRGGSFTTTTTTINLCCKLIEFNPHHNLVHNFKVDNTPKQNTEEYDIIIGRDIIRDLGVEFKFSTAIPTMSWDNISIPMRKKGFLVKRNIGAPVSHVQSRIFRS